ncbi:MAG TPA: LysE family transporter [Bacteroidales bacterium]|nr:LysE family transporter [Bacteroidales bacterium]
MGAILGLTSGITPGPLLTLVISETLKHNRAEGMKVAISPFITDLPIIIVSFFVFSKLQHLNIILGIISLFGGAFMAYMGYRTWQTRGIRTEMITTSANSLQKGITANLLNPTPYLFWVSIGTPLILQALHVNVATLIFFLAVFYMMLIGSKMTIVLLISRSKSLLSNLVYFGIMRFLALVLCVFALFFIRDGFKYLMK